MSLSQFQFIYKVFYGLSENEERIQDMKELQEEIKGSTSTLSSTTPGRAIKKRKLNNNQPIVVNNNSNNNNNNNNNENDDDNQFTFLTRGKRPRP